MRRRPNPASGHAVRQRSVPSVVLLLKVQLEGHAFRQFLEQFLELRAGGGGDLDGHLRHLRGRADAPAFDLADQVERRRGGVRQRGGRGWGVLPPPPKMPSGVGAGGAPGNMSPPGTGGVPPSPPNDPPPLVGAGAGAGGVEPPVAGTAEGSITNTSSRWRPVSESLGRRRRHAVSSSSPGWVCRYSMPRTLMATLPLAHRRRMRSFIVVLPSQAMQSCPAGRGS